eukprot:2063963-Rhodomonas_salina.2
MSWSWKRQTSQSAKTVGDEGAEEVGGDVAEALQRPERGRGSAEARRRAEVSKGQERGEKAPGRGGVEYEESLGLAEARSRERERRSQLKRAEASLRLGGEKGGEKEEIGIRGADGQTRDRSTQQRERVAEAQALPRLEGRVERESLQRRAEAAIGMEEEARRSQSKASHPEGLLDGRLS